MKKAIYIVLFIHSLVICTVLWDDLTAKGDSWSWLITFVVDYPLPMIFYPVIDFVLRHNLIGAYGESRMPYVLMHFFAHLFIGGTWWVFLAWLLNKATARLKRTLATSEGSQQ